MSKKRIPQYHKNGMWKLINEETGEFWGEVFAINVFEDYAKDCLYYSFNTDNKHGHAHEFESVLKACFDYPETFNLNEEDKTYYTERQLSFLNNLQNQCLKDNLKDISVNNNYNLDELKKRNYQQMIENLKEDNY